MLKINLKTFDLSQLPATENDDFEFKSSQTPLNDLKKKLSCAASGFANSGGGCFVAGVDDHGNADNGFSLKIGKQDLRDWVDQVINQVEPAPQYDIKLINDSAGRGTIETDSAVLLVLIHESYIGPHMAPDYHYYIRAGAHTVKAKHFIIDAIWAKRHFSKPRLTHLLRSKPGNGMAIQLGILALTDAPAINVTIKINPLPQLLQAKPEVFPLNLSLVDRSNPFFMDIKASFLFQPGLENSISLEVEYHDLANNSYVYETIIESSNFAFPIVLGNSNSEEIVKMLKSINDTLAKFPKK